MDNLTHSLVGALIGQAGLKRRTGLAMPALVIGANLPDVDAACFIWLEGAEHLGFRRGITHGPPALVILPLVLASVLWSYDRWQQRRGSRPEARPPVRFGWLFGLSFIACLSHPALDWTNVYGIRLLAPFSGRWFYGDALFIVDVWLWLLLGAATWLSLRLERRRNPQWRAPATAALAFTLAYVAAQWGISEAQERRLAGSAGWREAIASPRPVDPFSRQTIVGSGNGLWLVDGRRRGAVPLAQCALAALRRSDPQVDAFLTWSRTPMIERVAGGWVLRDARFAEGLTADRFTVRLPAGVCRPG